MKKIILLLSLTLFLYSCGASKSNFEKTMNNAYIGMTIMEFNKFAKNKELVSMKEGVSVYLLKQYNWYDHDGADGTLANYRYFYFEDNKLIQMDRGQRATDLRIKIDK